MTKYLHGILMMSDYFTGKACNGVTDVQKEKEIMITQMRNETNIFSSASFRFQPNYGLREEIKIVEFRSFK